MTLFAGAYCLNAADEIPPELRAGISAHLRATDRMDGERAVIDCPGAYLLSWDSGVFGENSWLPDSDGLAIKIAGDALLCENGQRLSRTKQARRIAAALAKRDTTALSDCRGSFALAAYDSKTHSLQLGTDALGLRSVYYLVQDGILVFATALRILEAIPGLRRSLSTQGMAEISAFSFPLAQRTPYSEIKLLCESELLIASEGDYRVQQYDNWALGPAEVGEGIEQAAERLYGIFKEAVDVRAGGDRNVYSFLSGGMDSRSIVATLLAGGRHVEALNFSATASQDQIYAQRFAEQIPQQCTVHCLPGGSYPNFSFLALAAKTELERTRPVSVCRPQFIWSGDGGSVGLGHVYMDEVLLEKSERSGVADAARYFLQLNRIVLPSGILAERARSKLPQQLLDTVIEEIKRYPNQDVGRSIYLFLLFNDQRRHLFKHFETIDEHGLELLTPFYDTQFLKAISATPSRWGILHRLYAKWFEHLPGYAQSTPWQTYPGHVPCPVKDEEAAGYQWSIYAEPKNTALGERIRFASQLIKTCRAARRPETFSTARVWLAAGLHVLGLRDCRHLLSVLKIYAKHSRHVNQV